MIDPINPDHYKGEVECIDAMASASSKWMNVDHFQAHCLLTAMKYLWRAPLKGDLVDNIRKAIWYLRMSIGDDPRNDRG